ncbi:restriction endonuclease subunit S [Collimonas sp. NPDC087041]|uniref:restriction endonuclease subunit S n=1 Tax=Collimonas sp. NPDC087041 TaxID=3363960 RepID=UPI00381C3ADD
MSSEWQLKKLSSLGSFERGKSKCRPRHAPHLYGGPYPFIQTGDITNADGRITSYRQTYSEAGLSQSKLWPAGTLCITIAANIAETALLTFPACFPDSVVGFIPDSDKADVIFIEYLFRMMRENVKSKAYGTAQENINLEVLRDLAFPVPNLANQRAIASTLSVFDDRISLLRETNTTLEAIAHALFQSWFVDFAPVRAKQDGREPEGMDAETAALFPERIEESELGSVPSGWKLVPFGELLCHTIGGDWGEDAPDETNDVRVAIIRGTDIPDLKTGTNNRVPVRYTSRKKLASRKLQDGDIVLEVSGGSKDQPTGRALYLTDGLLGQFDCPVEPASFCRLLRPNTKTIGVLLAQHLTYIYRQGKTWAYQNQSTGISNFQTTHFLETELVALPPDAVLTAFANLLKPMVDRAHLTQVKQLATLRDTLLPRLISGQLRLPEAETMLEEVAA